MTRVPARAGFSQNGITTAARQPSHRPLRFFNLIGLAPNTQFAPQEQILAKKFTGLHWIRDDAFTSTVRLFRPITQEPMRGIDVRRLEITDFLTTERRVVGHPRCITRSVRLSFKLETGRSAEVAVGMAHGHDGD